MRALASRLPAPVRVTLVVLLLIGSTLLHCIVLFAVALLKLLVPLRPARRRLSLLLAAIAESWIAFNSLLFRIFTTTEFEVTGIEGLRRDGRYLVLSNHRSWVDIPVLQRAFNRRIPFMRFFLKSQLIWVPVLGLAWWALDFPFMKRYSREQLARQPELAGRDLEATRRACRRFADIPVAIVNFVEGTRFSEDKRSSQSSPFRHLLRPRAGGAGFVLGAVGSGLDAILDVTLSYDPPAPDMQALVGNRIRRARVEVRELETPAAFLGADFDADPALRHRFHAWLNACWQRKDERLARIEAGRTSGKSDT